MDRYEQAADRIERGCGSKADAQLLQHNWGRRSRMFDTKVQRYQDAVKKWNREHPREQV